MPDWPAKYQEARIFFLFNKKCLLKKKNSVFPNSNEYNNMYVILEYLLVHYSFDYIWSFIYIIYNKFITFLSYFDHDRNTLILEL